MNIEVMRLKVSQAYEGPAWKAKVHRMHDNQIVAIYYNFLKSGKFDAVRKRKVREAGHQMTIWDYPLEEK